MCTVSGDVTFSDTDGNVQADFATHITAATSASAIEGIFTALVSAAEGDTLVSGKVVLANTVTYGPREFK